MSGDLSAQIETVLGERIVRSCALPVGFGLEGLEVRLADGRQLAVKAWAAGAGPSLELEGYMLGELARLSALPVPRVHYADADLLVMDFIEADGGSPKAWSVTRAS